uniref:Fatty acid binding protein 6, ileal (gastrotropin) n=1 Tax=Oryzias latipes TaxID=8090 RepID=A0A3P9IQ68_ORYLA
MTFAGRWEIESQEGYDEFCKVVGIPADVIEKGRDYKAVTEVTQNGDEFTWTQVYPTIKVTNKFTIGKECEMESLGGKKFKATVNMEGGKMTVNFPNYTQTNEISGGKLIEVNLMMESLKDLSYTFMEDHESHLRLRFEVADLNDPQLAVHCQSKPFQTNKSPYH